MTITPRQFVDTWARSELREQQAAQSHFIMLCELVSHQTPAQLDPEGRFFTFEEQVEKATGGQGRADVWYKDHFAWEYKGKHKDLDSAYAQLLAYRGGLGNPPLLIVCDFLEYRIYPQWPNASAQPFKFRNEDLLNAETRRYITWLLESPAKFLELRQTELERREDITRDLAEHFAELARLMRLHKRVDGRPAWEPMQIARFLAKLTFALFAEDIDLLPRPFKQPVFRVLVESSLNNRAEFAPNLEQLFKAMDGQVGFFMMQPVPYFNGGIFADSAPGANDGTQALDLAEIPGGIETLGKASEADWRFVNPSIFGTLFEGALDESKRAQLGAHYTSEDDIRLVIEPVLMEPLNQKWQALQAQIEPLMQAYLKAETPKSTEQAREKLVALYDDMLATLENTRVLDPACGSGNFLYVALRALKDLEGKVRRTFEPLGLPFRDVVTPRQLYGLEKDEFAAKLAHIVMWIGYLQWRYEDEGVLHPYKKTSSPHPRQLPNPILQDKYRRDEPDHVQCADSILRYRPDGSAYEPEWPAVDVIVGNPPFLGGKRLRSELKDNYVNDLFKLYADRVSHEADLVCYWFEKARAALEAGTVKRVGLLATNSIRGGANRNVLARIKRTGDIFMAWGDRPWVLDGAAVRISIVGFDKGIEHRRVLNGQPVGNINADLTGTADLTLAKRLLENSGIAFIGVSQHGPFEVTSKNAESMLQDDPVNARVVKRIINAHEIAQNSENRWVIDFEPGTTLDDVAKYRLPLKYVTEVVLPIRKKNHRKQYRERWWLLGESRPAMRIAIHNNSYYIATPRVAKHRLFVKISSEILPSDALVAIARSDDYFFGALHAYPHELWALRLGTWLGKGNDPRYTPTTTFETFPLPYAPGQEPAADPAYVAISAAAKALHEERTAWLNPPNKQAAALREYTLTNLYNALSAYREAQRKGEAYLSTERNLIGGFAPRLAELHRALDTAVLRAYGWEDLIDTLRTPNGDEELLRRLLSLNMQRGQHSAAPLADPNDE